jgi:hypothetical protein
MRPSTVVRLVAAIAAAWALAGLAMVARGDAEGRRTLVELLLVGMLVGGLAWAAFRFRIGPRRGSFDAQARRAGLHPQAGDPIGLLGMPFSLFRRAASVRDLENTARGVRGGREIVVADYWYAPSSNPSLDDHRRFVCVIDPDRRGWPDLAVTPMGPIAAARDAVGLARVEMESERFNRAFEVRTNDRRFAAALLDARMMDWLMQQAPGMGVEIADGRLIVFEPRSTASIDDVERALRRFDDVLQHMPSVVRSWYPAPERAAPARPDR